MNFPPNGSQNIRFVYSPNSITTFRYIFPFTCAGIKVERREMTILDTMTMDNITEAHSPSVYTGSPPHYQEDILHRLHNLEEEYLRLSLGSYASSDTDTSDSENEHVETKSVIIHHDSARSMDNISFFSCEDLTKTIEDESFIVKDGDSELLGNNGYEASPNDGEIVGLLKQEASWLDQKTCKRKPKTRVVSLTDDDYDAHAFNNFKTRQLHKETSISDYRMLVEGMYACIGGSFNLFIYQ